MAEPCAHIQKQSKTKRDSSLLICFVADLKHRVPPRDGPLAVVPHVNLTANAGRSWRDVASCAPPGLPEANSFKSSPLSIASAGGPRVREAYSRLSPLGRNRDCASTRHKKARMKERVPEAVWKRPCVMRCVFAPQQCLSTYSLTASVTPNLQFPQSKPWIRTKHPFLGGSRLTFRGSNTRFLMHLSLVVMRAKKCRISSRTR